MYGRKWLNCIELSVLTGEIKCKMEKMENVGRSAKAKVLRHMGLKAVSHVSHPRGKYGGG